MSVSAGSGASICALLLLLRAGAIQAQEYSSSIETRYRVSANVTYVTLGGWEGRLDVYARADATEPRPTLVFIHGGSVEFGRKENQIFSLLPYLERGWNVVNLEPRLNGVTLAPDVVGNVRCALKWIHDKADDYGFDPARIVLSGASSGGWFAVAAALGRELPGWEALCPGSQEVDVAAIVDWYGNWDLADILEGPNTKPYAAEWVRGYPNPMAIAELLSPLPVRSDAPPMISIHGDADPVVPYSQSVRLQEALAKAGIANKLVTIPDGGHGGFSRDENGRAYDAIFEFLSGLGIR